MLPLVATKEILIVEDSLTQALQLQHILSQRGYSSVIARDGDEALKILESLRPALVLCDIVMPGMDGYELCTRIKETIALNHVPVVLLTQLADPEDIIRGLKARADCYSTKPYNPQYLISTIETLLDNAAGAIVEHDDTLEVMVSGKTYNLKADRRQMLNLLLSVYGSAVQRNRELVETQSDLQAANEELAEQQGRLEEANRQLETLATRDSLTGLYNRRAFNQRLQEEMNRSTRQGTPLSLVLIDVDHFKAVNDNFGHLAGDEKLAKVAALLRECSRDTDFQARYGGEEFGILLPGADEEGALLWAERTRARIEAGPWEVRAITCSMGVSTTYPGPRPTQATLFVDEADKALYYAKANGRNRVVHFKSLEN